MPLYDYHCVHCKIVVEKRHGMHEQPPVACPRCGRLLPKRPTAPAVKYNSFGFYSTDKNLRPDELAGMTKDRYSQQAERRNAELAAKYSSDE